MFDGDMKSKSVTQITGGCMFGGSDSEQGSGVSTSLAVLESEDRRIRLDDADPDEEQDDDSEDDNDDDGDGCSNDTEVAGGAGVVVRCATLELFGTRLGSGAAFF